ncbi:chromatin-modulating protein MRC1 [Nakaseomyces bracarensis]|uniref:chromatin-modulating protein MRC1 n=1 Tax=Nakaseomyces bracarensis TaxID=273131 RepID=UPI003871ACA5
MDSLFEDLDKVKIQKRTTYKKVQAFEEDINNAEQVSYGVPTYNTTKPDNTAGKNKVPQKGFVFNSDKLFKIRNRLENPEEENSSNTTTEGKNDGEVVADITQPTQSATQLISDFYEGGEDLDQDDIIGARTQVIYEKRNRPMIRLKQKEKEHKVIPTQTYDKSRLRRRKFEQYDENIDRSEDEETQETQINETEPINNSTQRIMVTGQSLLFSSTIDNNDGQQFDFQTSGKSLLFQSTQNDDVDEEVFPLGSSLKPTQVLQSTPSTVEDKKEPISKIGNIQSVTPYLPAPTYDETQRINGSIYETQETQLNTLIQESSTDNNETQETQSITQRISDNLDTQQTQINYNTQKFRDVQKTQPTQLTTQKVNEDLFNKETQAIGSASKQSFADTSMPVLPLFANNNEVTQKDQQKTQIDADFPVTQSDENSTNLTHLKIRAIEKELQEEEKAHNIQTEYRAPVKQSRIPVKINFTKDSFLANFDSDSDSNDDINNDQIQENIDSSSLPNNDFMTDQRMSVTPSSDYQVSEGEDKHTSNFSSSPAKPTKNKNSILPSYANNLMREINPEKGISLSSDSDNDSDLEVINKLSNKSKATLLSLRVRLSKNNPAKKKNADKNSLGLLFSTLKKASKQQIVQHRKDLMESKGLRFEDLEEEKKMVEDLLEQEIERNLKIREREKRREQLEIGNDDVAPEESEFEYSGDESDMSASDNEIASSELAPENDYIEEVTYGSKLAAKSSTIGSKSSLNEQDEEEGISLSKKVRNKRMQVLDSESENESSNFNALDTQPLDTQEIGSVIPPMNMDFYVPNKTVLVDNDTEVQEEIEDKELSEKDRIAAIKAHLQEQRIREEREQKKLSDLKRKGINNFLEDEAEESDDEWKGIGGMDGEQPDEIDSEVEKMIDDYSKVDDNLDSLRKKIMEENKEMDLKLVNKILYDIKNGGFRKRGRSELELELSDEEDAELREFRKRRKELMRQRMLEFGDDDKLMKNPKSKAFFESMVIDINEAKQIPLEFALEENNDPSPMTQDEISLEANNKEDATTKKSKIKISEEFVQKSLSFLRVDESSQEFQLDRKIAQVQHASISDINELKRNSSLSFCTKLSSSRKIQNLDEDIIDEFESYKRPSIIQSFGSKFDINDKFKEGNKTVKISKSYKAVGGSKASITYLGKSRKLVAPKKNHTMRKSNIQSSSRLLNIQRDSFES